MLEVLHHHGWSFFPTFRWIDGQWEGVVHVMAGQRAQTEHICLRRRETQSEAWEDAVVDALQLVDMV